MGLQKPLLKTDFHPFKSGAVPFLMSITLPLLSGEPSGFSLACIICVLLINMIRACSLLRLLLSACKSRELYFITFRVHKTIYENANHSLLVVYSKFMSRNFKYIAFFSCLCLKGIRKALKVNFIPSVSREKLSFERSLHQHK